MIGIIILISVAFLWYYILIIEKVSQEKCEGCSKGPQCCSYEGEDHE